MNIDNSSNTYVFDAKTTQAIEEGKNRVTLLQVEELRLNKLKGSLEADLIKLEADLTYKTDRLTVKRDELDELELAIESATKQLNATNKYLDEVKTDIETRLKATEVVEANNTAKEKELKEREAVLSKTESNLAEDRTAVATEKEEISAKIKRIDDFLRSL